MAKNTPEDKVKQRVKKILDDYIKDGEPVTYFSVMPTPYTTRGVSDFVVVVNGRIPCLEIKAQGKKPTDAQKYFGERVQEANGIYLVVAGSSDEALRSVDRRVDIMLAMDKPRHPL